MVHNNGSPIIILLSILPISLRLSVFLIFLQSGCKSMSSDCCSDRRHNWLSTEMETIEGQCLGMLFITKEVDMNWPTLPSLVMHLTTDLALESTQKQ